MNTFDLIISDLMHDENGTLMLEESLKFDVNTAGKVPLRYRIIALGFVKKFTLDELNEKLEANGCARLYARSLWEAGLFYAFLNGLSYDEWKHINDKCISIRDSAGSQNEFFSSSSVTFHEIEQYLLDNSDGDRQALATKHLTQLMEKKISEAATGRGGFEAFLTENIRAFSLVREKTRYYFCKYLYYVLRTRIDSYVNAISAGRPAAEAIRHLSMFKGITPLQRKKMSAEESRRFLESCAISCGEIFDDFNYFFFEYVDLDWISVLYEYYGSLDAMPAEEKLQMAAALRRQDPKKYGSLSDEEIVAAKQKEFEESELKLDHIYSQESSGKGYQRNRTGENTIRKYIRGTLDIDRTTLVCFLLFFGANAELPENDRITAKRLTQILLSCGFPGLRSNDDFDLFVQGYLDADDRVDYLMQEVTNYALEEENFHLYHVYKNSTSYHSEFEKLAGI